MAVDSGWSPGAGRGEVAGTAVPVLPVSIAGVALLAYVLRIWAIDAVPLAPDEATRALEAWAMSRGETREYAAGPLLTNLIAIAFGLFTAADGAARLPSVLAGVALALTPLLYRPWVGSEATFLACLLIALSPSGVFASRMADPAVLVALAAAVAVGCTVQACERADGKWVLASAVAVAVGLGASGAFVGQFVAVVFAYSISPPLQGAVPFSLRNWIPRAAAVGLGAAVLLDTLFLTRPAGLQAGLIDPSVEWIMSLGLSGMTSLSVGLLLIGEFVLVVLALFAAPMVVRTPQGRFLVIWSLAGLALAWVRRAPDLGTFASTLVPMALVAGSGLARWCWLRRARRPAVWFTALALLGLAVFLAVSLNGANRANTFSPTPLVMATVGAVAILLVASNWLSLEGLGAAVGLAAVAGIVVIGTSLLHRVNYDRHERGAPALLGQAGRPELRLIEARARDWRRQDPLAPVQVDATLRPVLAWSLRDGPPVEWLTGAPPSAERAILGGATAGQRPRGDWIRLEVAERYSAPPEAPGFSSIWRWLVRREPLVRSEPHAILTTF